MAVTLGEMLYVMVETLIARLLGSRLALRGPEGSINVANRHLAKALANCTKHFIVGLQWFLLSILVHALKGMHNEGKLQAAQTSVNEALTAIK